MRGNILCDPYLWENPGILLRTSFFYSTNTVCVSELLNHIALVVIVLGAVGFVIHSYTKSKVPLLILLLLGMFLITPSAIAIATVSRGLEGFQSSAPGSVAAVKAPVNMSKVLSSVDVIGSGNYGIASASYTAPSARNPFMNVLVDELKYNPTRPPAASVLDPSVQIGLDEFFRTEFARDPTDVFGRNQSQRQFITMPSTSIPNDVDSYQKWLYKIPGKTCKEGGREACLPGTDGAAIPWLNQNQ